MATYIATHCQCADAPGIVRAASSAIFDVGGNILENDQFTDPVTNQFCMRSRFEIGREASKVVRARLDDDLVQFSPALHVRNEEVRRRALVMVSQYEHCLAELLYRRDQGDLPLDIVAVVSNHADLRRPRRSLRRCVPRDRGDAQRQGRCGGRDCSRCIREYDVDFVILARYMQILSPAALRRH